MYCGYFLDDGFQDEFSEDKTVHHFIEAEEYAGKIESRMECDEKHCYLYHLDIVPEARGKGLGSCVIKEAENLAEEKNVDYLNASIGVEHSEGEYGISKTKDLFEKLGFDRGLIGNEEDIAYGRHWILHFHKRL